MKLLTMLGSALLACALFAFSPAFGADKAAAEAKKPINKKCPVEGGDVDPKVTTEYKGKLIGFCCDGCPDEFKKDPAKYMAIVDKELAADKKGDGAAKDDAKKDKDAKKGDEKQAELNAKCPVSGDDADKAITQTYKGRTIA